MVYEAIEFIMIFVCLLCNVFEHTKTKNVFFFNFQKINVFFLFGIFVMLNFSNCNLNAFFLQRVVWETNELLNVIESSKKTNQANTLFTFCVCWRNKHVFEELFVIDMFCFRCLIVLINCYFSTGLLLFSLVILCVVFFPCTNQVSDFHLQHMLLCPFFFDIYI